MDGTTRPPRWRERMGMEEFGNKIGGDGSPDDLVECSISVRFAIPGSFPIPVSLAYDYYRVGIRRLYELRVTNL